MCFVDYLNMYRSISHVLQAFFYEIDYFTSLEKIRDEMCEDLKVYLSVCSSNTELKISGDSLKGEVENMKHQYEEMMLLVSEKLYTSNNLNNVCIHMYVRTYVCNS